MAGGAARGAAGGVRAARQAVRLVAARGGVAVGKRTVWVSSSSRSLSCTLGLHIKHFEIHHLIFLNDRLCLVCY